MIGVLLLVCLISGSYEQGEHSTDSITGLDTTATELSVIESVFRLGEGAGPEQINTTRKETMVESFY